MTIKNFKISQTNEENLKNLKKIVKIEKGSYISEAKIINIALAQFFNNKKNITNNNDYSKQVEVLKCFQAL